MMFLLKYQAMLFNYLAIVLMQTTLRLMDKMLREITLTGKSHLDSDPAELRSSLPLQTV